MKQHATEQELRDQAVAWIAADPDPRSQAELQALLDDWPAGVSELADRFRGPLRFGTAGLRGQLRAGPNGMNQAVVRGAAAGLLRWLADQHATGPLVVGYDARHGSRTFAEETARVATGAGRPALLLPGPMPTPVLAYAVRAVAAAAGVMITASHNPPQDNGFKVFLGEQLGGPTGAGAQLAPPVDAEIEAAIEAAGQARGVPLGSTGSLVDQEVVDAYVAAAAGLVQPDSPRELAVAYTPLHGVGAGVFGAALARAGFAPPTVVPAQAQPDPDFPTVSFPNPEEPGTTDQLLAAATAAGADLALAHDPDADRCAVAIPAGGGRWRPLTGDELGVLLADQLMRRGTPGRYVTTVVSSSLLRALCAARGVRYGETLTGFKWIVRAGADLAYGYEEALGYCVAPQLVRDKDGITAALLTCELAAQLRATGHTLADRLDELACEFGVYATDQLSVRCDDITEITQAVSRLRRAPPTRLRDEPVTAIEDLLPEADVVIVRTATSRLVVRPSGTEPKLKAYLEVVEPAAARDEVAAARTRAATALRELQAHAAELLSQP